MDRTNHPCGRPLSLSRQRRFPQTSV